MESVDDVAMFGADVQECGAAIMMVYYFGVWPSPHGTVGHYLYTQKGDKVYPNPLPWGYEMDGAMCPGKIRAFSFNSLKHQGEAKIHVKDDWAALAFWDSSGDERGASCSVFFLSDTGLDFDQLVDIFKHAFPALWERFDFEVRLVE